MWDNLYRAASAGTLRQVQPVSLIVRSVKEVPPTVLGISRDAIVEHALRELQEAELTVAKLQHITGATRVDHSVEPLGDDGAVEKHTWTFVYDAVPAMAAESEAKDE